MSALLNVIEIPIYTHIYVTLQSSYCITLLCTSDRRELQTKNICSFITVQKCKIELHHLTRKNITIKIEMNDNKMFK